MEILAPGGSFDFSSGSAVALGSFDGLHIGHKTIINDVIRYAHNSGMNSVVFTFVDHPTVGLGGEIQLITPLDIKAELLEQMGLDCLCLEDFSPQFMALSPEMFVETILKRRLNAKYVSAGFNYRFGQGARGNAEMLSRLCKERGISCSIHGAVTVDGQTVSSTAIREFIGLGDMDEAKIYLGRDFFLQGEVKKGRTVGRALGFPTANILPPDDMAIPGNGVYLTLAEYQGVKYLSLTNVGTAPTFGRMQKTIETHILNFAGDLYGKELRVYFLKRLRFERKFSSPAELRLQLARDKETAVSYFKNNDILSRTEYL